MAGGLRDVFLLKDFTLLSGFLAIWITVTLGNLILHKYNLSALSQPVAHSQYLWSFLGMAAVGWGSILLGGCPLRQLILAGEGNGDSAVTVLGMLVGAAVSHNFSLQPGLRGRGRHLRHRRHRHQRQSRCAPLLRHPAGGGPDPPAGKGGEGMIDTRGYSCPTPVILVQKAVKSGAPAELEVLADAMVAVENITRYARSQGYTTTVTPDGEDYRLTLKKG